MGSHTVRPGDLAPDHANVGAPDLTLGPVDKGDLLAQVEAGSLRVINALDLNQTVGVADQYSVRPGFWGMYRYLVLGLVLRFPRW